MGGHTQQIFITAHRRAIPPLRPLQLRQAMASGRQVDSCLSAHNARERTRKLGQKVQCEDGAMRRVVNCSFAQSGILMLWNGFPTRGAQQPEKIAIPAEGDFLVPDGCVAIEGIAPRSLLYGVREVMNLMYESARRLPLDGFVGELTAGSLRKANVGLLLS